MAVWGYVAIVSAGMESDAVALRAWKDQAEHHARVEARKLGFTVAEDVTWNRVPLILDPELGGDEGVGELRQAINGEVPTAYQWRLTAEIVT